MCGFSSEGTLNTRATIKTVASVREGDTIHNKQTRRSNITIKALFLILGYSCAVLCVLVKYRTLVTNLTSINLIISSQCFVCMHACKWRGRGGEGGSWISKHCTLTSPLCMCTHITPSVAKFMWTMFEQTDSF